MPPPTPQPHRLRAPLLPRCPPSAHNGPALLAVMWASTAAHFIAVVDALCLLLLQALAVVDAAGAEAVVGVLDLLLLCKGTAGLSTAGNPQCSPQETPHPWHSIGLRPLTAQGKALRNNYCSFAVCFHVAAIAELQFTPGTLHSTGACPARGVVTPGHTEHQPTSGAPKTAAGPGLRGPTRLCSGRTAPAPHPPSGT